MKKILIATIAFFMAVTAFSQTSGLGVGVILGSPTGLSAKMWTSGSTALDAAAAWDIRNGGFLHLHADFLLHPFEIDVPKGDMPLYFGIGGRVLIASDPHVGVRIPFGVAYGFAEAPFDVFLEIVPILDILPSMDFDMNGAIGFRYYLE